VNDGNSALTHPDFIISKVRFIKLIWNQYLRSLQNGTG